MLQSRWRAEENYIFLLTFLVIAQSFKETAVCSLISNTVSLVFIKQSKSVSSMYMEIITGFKWFTLEMWLPRSASIWLLDFG